MSVTKEQLHGIATIADQADSPLRVLEAMIDKHGLTYVVSGLATICDEKGNHIRHSWGDYDLARVWEHDGSMLDKAARNVMSDG